MTAKAVIDLFKQILIDSDADPTAKGKLGAAQVASRIVMVMVGTEELRDDGSFQLIKQTRKSSNLQWLKFTWDLFLIVVTIIPSSRNSENWIKVHLFQSSRQAPDPTISDITQFTFIHFTARCIIGKPFGEIVSIPFIQRIPVMSPAAISPLARRSMSSLETSASDTQQPRSPSSCTK
jgi:hypothetical protein